ncbi:MAG TPA: chemotaxis response regulator protein-glutamate methylesterase [Holophaga sp.]|nr:chemotaxis response regulator protein-glutamate methylesterase [Holophaga sp.]
MDDPRLKVLIVDDTIVYRKILSDVVESLEDAELAGTAPHGRLALAKLEQAPVDLVLLDVEMPEMGGLDALKEIRRRHPATQVVMISGTNMSSADITMHCLEQGALDFLRKPEGTDPEASRSELKDRLRPLLRHIRTRFNLQRSLLLSKDGPRTELPAPVVRQGQEPPAPSVPAKAAFRAASAPDRIDVVAIGVSTGGPNALVEVIPRLPADFPVPILLVQHMPPCFTASLAAHLDQRSSLSVREAKDGEPVLPGHVLIAPGGKHMVVRRMGGEEGGSLIVGLNENPPENSCRPSVDVLFRSVAAHFRGNMLAVIMTGMGNDGCEGVRAMKRQGCLCLSQTEDSCVVYGMPLAVDEAGLSDERVPLDRLAERIDRLARKQRGA